MLTDKPLRLTTDILGIHSVCGTRTSTVIPEHAIAQVVPGKLDGRMVDVLWSGHAVTVFPEDLEQRGTLVQSVRGSRSASG